MGEQKKKPSLLKNVAYGLVKTSAVVGGFYAVRGYMRDRLEEVKVKMEDEERAKDVLRTRFQQTLQDTSYTILALMPTLSTQVMQHMDVDALTRELQARSHARTSRHIENDNARAAEPSQPPNIITQSNSRPPSSVSSNIDIVSPALIYPPNPYPVTTPSININTTSHHHPQDQEADARSDVDSVSHTTNHSSAASELGMEDALSPATTTSLTGISSSFISDSGSVTRSWVVDSSSASGSEARSALERSRSPAAASVSNSERMSESVLSVTTNTSSSDSEMNIRINDTRSKAELWNEVKMLTLTRTLTTLYSSTLLCLFTTLQLTLLARGRYVSSVLAHSKDERRKEKLEAEVPSVVGLIVRTLVFPPRLPGTEGGRLEKVMGALEEWFGPSEGDEEDEDSLGFGGEASLLGFDRIWDQKRKQSDEEEGWGFGWRSSGDNKGKGKAPAQPHQTGSSNRLRSGQAGVEIPWTGEITEDLENKYLTMSWWLLHVGWKDVGERVRRGVEEVFDGVSLKTKLAAVDLHRLINDVRRRVEYEITFEGNEKRTNFLSSLLPPTPETIHHVLTQGGYMPPASGTVTSDPFDARQQEMDFHLGQSATQTSHEASSAPSSSRHRQKKGHERRISDLSERSTSLESSQLSYNFVNSPAMGLSTRVDNDLLVSRHPGTGPHATQPALLHPSQTQYLAPSSLPPQPPTSSLLDPAFLSLLEETRSVLASPDFVRVLEVCLDRATEVLFESLEKNVFSRADEGEREGQGAEQRIRLAGLLPGLARWSQLPLDGLPNELVDKILDLREVSCLSAIAFARFEERFGSWKI